MSYYRSGDTTMRQNEVVMSTILSLSMIMMIGGWSDGKNKDFRQELVFREKQMFELNPTKANTCFPSGRPREETLISGTASVLRKNGYLAKGGYEITPAGVRYLKKLFDRIIASEGIGDGALATFTRKGAALVANTANTYYNIPNLFPVDDEV